jgi:hypothetical protein
VIEPPNDEFTPLLKGQNSVNIVTKSTATARIDEEAVPCLFPVSPSNDKQFQGESNRSVGAVISILLLGTC